MDNLVRSLPWKYGALGGLKEYSMDYSKFFLCEREVHWDLVPITLEDSQQNGLLWREREPT